MKPLTTAEINQLIAEGKLPKYYLPRNPERADELADRVLEGGLTPEEEAELTDLWSAVEVPKEIVDQQLADLFRRIKEYKKRGTTSSRSHSLQPVRITHLGPVREHIRAAARTGAWADSDTGTGALALEESERIAINVEDEWRVQPTDAKVDAARAIDYVLRGPENTTYLVQLTSTRWRDAISIKRKAFTDREPKRDVNNKTDEKEMRFWRGARSFIAGRQLKPSSVRAVFLQLSQNNIDATTGRPDAALKGEIGKYLDHLVAPDYAWSTLSRRSR